MFSKVSIALERGRSPNGKAMLRRPSGGFVQLADAVELLVEQCLRCAVSKTSSRQSIDDVSKIRYVLLRIVRDALALRYGPAQHPVMTFIRALLEGRIRVCEIHCDTLRFQLAQTCEL